MGKLNDFDRSKDRAHIDENGKEWQDGMLNQPCANPLYCCVGCFCGCCFAYKQRERILDISGDEYKPCGGYFCCCETPELPKIPFLCCEACCCTWTAIMVNRYMVRDMYNLKLDPCDECLLWCACIVSWLVCILKCFGVIEEDSICDVLADCFIMSVMGCSLAQNEAELDFHTGQ